MKTLKEFRFFNTDTDKEIPVDGADATVDDLEFDFDDEGLEDEDRPTDDLDDSEFDELDSDDSDEYQELEDDGEYESNPFDLDDLDNPSDNLDDDEESQFDPDSEMEDPQAFGQFDDDLDYSDDDDQDMGYPDDNDMNDEGLEDEGDLDTAAEPEKDPDYQGSIRTVKGAYLVYKRQGDDGTFSELWIYNVGKDMKQESSIRRNILAGTDIPPNKERSPDGEQQVSSYSVGNIQYLEITGLPN